MRRAAIAGVLCAFLTLAAARSFAQDSPAPAVAFTHVNVIDATGAAEKADHTVLIREGRIVAVGPSKEVRIPKGVRVVKARGKYLIPGLWDMHVHILLFEPEVLPVFVAHGVLGIRELSTSMPQIEQLRAMARAGTLVVPRISASGWMIEPGPMKPIMLKTVSSRMVGVYLGNRKFVDTPEEARELVREAASARPDWIKLHNNLRRDVYFAVLDEAHRHGLPVAGHYPVGEKVTLREIADAGQRTLEHLSNQATSVFDVLGPQEKRATVAHVKDRGLAFVPTIVASMVEEKYSEEATPQARLGRVRGDSRARFVSPGIWIAWEEMLASEKASSEYKEPLPFEVSKSSMQAELGLIREMHKGGVPVLAGSDFGMQFLFPGSSLHEELIELVKQIAMTPHEALQSATRRPAELLGLQDSLGTVEPGKIADLVLLEANPLTDIGNVRMIHAVVQNGRVYDRRALDGMLDQAAAKVQQRNSPPTDCSPLLPCR